MVMVGMVARELVPVVPVVLVFLLARLSFGVFGKNGILAKPRSF